MVKSKKQIKDENVAREIQHIWDSWDYHLSEKFEGADRIIRQMFKEMSYAGSNFQNSVEFVRPRLQKMLEKIYDNG